MKTTGSVDGRVAGAVVVPTEKVAPAPDYTFPGPPISESEERAGKRRAFLWTWVLVSVLYFSWESAAYRGIFAYLTEWQFDHIGQDLPTFTFGLLTTAAAWPALHLFRRRREDQQDLAEDATEAERAEALAREEFSDSLAAIDAARDYMHYLWGFTAALLLAAIVALLWTLALPRLEGPTRSVDIAGAEPKEGPAELVGTVAYGRIASFSRGILFVRRSELYAPILPPGGKRSDIRYFVEFSPDERALIHSGASLTRRRGILVRNDLPGALVRLYRYLGYYPATRYFVLYASSQTIRWPYYMIAAQFILGALTFVISALFQQRHLGKIVRIYQETYEGRPEQPKSGRRRRRKLR